MPALGRDRRRGFAARIGIQPEAPLLGERHQRTSTVAVTYGLVLRGAAPLSEMA